MEDIVYWIGRSPDPKEAILTFWDRQKALNEWNRVKDMNLNPRTPLKVFAATVLAEAWEVSSIIPPAVDTREFT